MEYHIALLKLKEDLDFEGSNGKIGKIKICVRDVAYLAEIWEYVTGEVVGWGWTTEKTCCGISDQLLATHQDVITNYECRRRLDQRLTGSSLRQQIIPHCTVFCTDDTKITMDDRAYLCKTDTGVPFIVNNTLYGIATWFMAECSVFPDQKKTRIVMYNRLSCYGLYSWITETTMKITNKLL
ncbi:hypodermin-A-like [Chrysoperla carnea]|uniref:hypodermin-A-like n=1 Tax=Chrysoperla carnea TaxID=189513 RepID=UPI001D06F430|nr:hypodermin-A-like [Chrysoperla carnea]